LIHLGARAEVHINGVHLLLRTYFSDRRYAYIVQNLNGGMPVAVCDERFDTAEEAMRMAEQVASRVVEVDLKFVKWTTTRTTISRNERSQIMKLPPEGYRDRDS
jgi:hypothetical protein